MARDRNFIQRLANAADIQDAPLPGIPLVEIAGDSRVLIENYFSVTQYDPCCVRVKVKFGYICVCGTNLELSRMSKGQLVVTGCIGQVQVVRGEG